ncbi:GMP synthase (glutamine-hydrolysing) [Promicromonospora sp. AC04]|uniref:glutamine amidotransferase n=1 Tax=Promicromonospora sp. AC04 TaxID=2135723 RepID=UPI000D3528F1|nr:glutamine amidotransferase [Promicromonospora sp. AC04]PUB27930.1 GMP synthase (glutamine-hydrolysing) [Promicromonospora sp. AC04]
MKPFLLLATRAEDLAADGEYAAFCRYGGLAPEQLHRVRLERDSLPPVDLDDYSGVVVGGGPFNSSDPVQKKSPVQRRVEAELATLLDEIVARDFPFLGACYGVGTLGAHQGAVIDPTFAEPVGPVTVELTPDAASDPLLAGLPQAFPAFVGHKEAVRKLPDDAVLLASSAGCPVQMFRIKQNLYATQFHPELDVAGIVQRIMIYRDYGYFPSEEAELVSERCVAVTVTEPMRIMRAFVERYAR